MRTFWFAAAQDHDLTGILTAQPEGQFIQPGHQTHMKTPADDWCRHAAVPLAVNLCEKFQSVQFQKAVSFDQGAFVNTLCAFIIYS